MRLACVLHFRVSKGLRCLNFLLLTLFVVDLVSSRATAQMDDLAQAEARCQATAQIYLNNFNKLNPPLCGGCTIETTVTYYPQIKPPYSPDENIGSVQSSVIRFQTGVYEAIATATCAFSPDAIPTPQLPTSLHLVDTIRSPVCPANSTINMDSLSLNETIPLVGIPFNLNYASDRLRPSSPINPKIFGLGGWTPDPLHFYDSKNMVVYYGNGGVRNIQAQQTTSGYQTTDESGHELYLFNSSGQLQKTLDALTGVLKYNFTYNAAGNIQKISDQFGNSTTFTSTSSTSLITSPYGQSTSLSLDASGMLSIATNPAGEQHKATYSGAGYLTSFTKPAGQRSSVAYDENGYITQDLGAGGDVLNISNAFDPNASTQTVKSSTALSRQTIFMTTTSATGSTHVTVDSSGIKFTMKDTAMSMNSSSNTYGDSYSENQAQDPRFGWLAPFAQSTSYTVPNTNINISSSENRTAKLSNPNDPLSFSTLTSQITRQGDPSRVYTATFDNTKKIITDLSPSGRTSAIQLNAQGQVSQFQVSNLVPSNFNYDERGRISGVTQGLRASSVGYDQYANVSSLVDALGRTVSFTYDRANRVSTETLQDGSKINFSYSPNGMLTSITPPGKSAHLFGYNLFDLASNYLPPILSGLANVQTEYSYNLDKQITQITMPNGNKVAFNYGATNGLLNSIVAPDGTYAISYGSNSELPSSLTSPDNEILSFQYGGSVLTQVNSSGLVTSSIKYGFNSDGAISQITTSGAGNAAAPIVLNYDKDVLLIGAGAEQLNRNSFGAIATSSLGKINEDLTYNNYGERISDKYTFINKKSLFETNYTRDQLGRITAVSRKSEERDHSRSYIFDKQGRLTTVVHGIFPERGYQYDQNGNRTALISFEHQIHASYDAQDRLTNYGNTEFQYTPNGDLSKKIEHKFDFDDRWNWHRVVDRDDVKITEYLYDSFGNLKEVTLPSGKLIQYIVDGQNRRIGKKVNGKMVQEFVYQSQTQIAAELDGNGNLVTQFVYGTKSNVPDYLIYKGSEYRIISDQVGTPKLVVDASTGKTVEEIEMDEFGVAHKTEGEHLLPFGFAGGIFDRDTGLVRMGARDYMPMVGRFISKDPIGFAGGSTNLYSYVVNDPINMIDPSGRLGVGLTYGGQVTAPGAGGTTTVSGVIGNDQSGGVSVGAGIQQGITTASGGFSIGQGPGFVVYGGTNQDYFNSGSININLPLVSITILTNGQGDVIGGGLSTRSLGYGINYVGPSQSFGPSGTLGGKNGCP